MKVTWYGTATIGIDDGKTRLLFDPFVRMNKRIETTPIEAFAGFDAVLLTHGHFDHMLSVPELTRIDNNVQVYCTESPKNSLESMGVASERITEIKPGDEIHIGDYTIRPRRFRHLVFDPVYILSIVPKCAVMLPRLIWQFSTTKTMPEAGETVAYEIEAHGKKIFLTGTFREFPCEEYPKDVDLFILAIGGCLFMPEKTKDFIARYHPKKILVDHIDNAFPPMTREVNLERLRKTIKKNHPDIEFIIPEICKEIEV